MDNNMGTTFDGVEHSKCVQTRISSPTDAAGAFMTSGSREISLVAVPSGAFLCCDFVSVPSGFFVLGQRWHKNIGAVDPGFKMCWPFFYRVSHIVTRATITYSAPSRSVRAPACCPVSEFR